MVDDKILQHYIEKSKEKDFDFSTMRKELEKHQMVEGEIKKIIRMVDQAMIDRARNEVPSFNLLNAKAYIVGGIVLIAFGVIATVASFLGLSPGPYIYIVYGPIISGILAIVVGFIIMKLPSSTGKISRRWAEKKSSTR